MGDFTIDIADEVRYLGVTIDRHTTYRTHINNLEIKGRRALNLLRMLSGRDWGATASTQKIIYKNMIEASITYGQEVYDSAHISNLHKLDKIQSAALRILTKSPRSTSTAAMQALTKIPPLSVLRKTAQLTYWSRIFCQNNHPLQKEFPTQWYQQRRTTEHHSSAFLKATKMKEELGINEAMMQSNKLRNPAPWELEGIQTDITLSHRFRKNEDSNTKIKQETLAHINDIYPTHLQIYTDGSKFEERVGSAFYVPNSGVRFCERITDNAAITTAELHAISLAMSNINRTNTTCFGAERERNKYIIMSDSLSAVQALLNDYDQTSRPDIVQQIALRNHILRQYRGVDVVVLWIPAHCDIAGNEIADKKAKEATRLGAPAVTLGLSISEINGLIRRGIRDRYWQAQWHGIHEAYLTKSIIPNVDHAHVCFGTPKTSRITRLRLGRPFFALNPRENKACGVCKRPLSIWHVLLQCRLFEEQRARLKSVCGVRDLTLKDILGITNGCRQENAARTFVNSLNIDI